MKQVFIVSHTHWDREWYLSFQQFRFKLIKLIDKLLHIMETDPRYKHFVLDGQTIVLEDYLDIRPENEGRLKKLIEDGRLSVGPWYILPDEFLISAEAHVRNLIIGMKVARRFGKPMNVGYMPDPFGHISQMPQILHSFGFDSFIFTRGMGDELEELGAEFYWQSPDGSKVITINQPATYCDGASLGYSNVVPPYGHIEPDMSLARQRISDIIRRHDAYSDLPAILVNNGVDHIEPQPELPVIMDDLQKQFPEYTFLHANFEHYIDAVQPHREKLKTYQGEFYQGKYHIILTGVLSTRMYLKQLNYRAQTLLEKYAEPILSYGLVKGLNAYPEHYLEYAWKLLLQNHPHDSICGCSVDRVHQDMVPRFHQVAEIAESLVMDQLNALVANDDVYDPSAENPSLIVFNPLPYVRSEIIRRIVKLPTPLATGSLSLSNESGAPVPCFATVIDPMPIAWDFTIPGVVSFDQQMERYAQSLSYLYSPESGSDARKTDGAFKIVALQFFAANLPGAGYKRYYLKNDATQDCPKQVRLDDENYVMENELVAVKLHENGTFDLTDKRTGVTFFDCHTFEDTEDVGDEYDYSPARDSQTISSSNTRGQVTVMEKTPISVKLKLEMELELPIKIRPNRKERMKERIPCFVSTTFCLEADSPVVKIQTSFDNQALDHRLRVLFPTNLTNDSCFADGHFSVEKRDVNIPGRDFSQWAQPPLGTRPQKNFVCLEDGVAGLAVFNKGLPEYEIIQSPVKNTIALTLFRSVGWLSRDDILTRRSNAGPSLATPDAQCPGLLKFEYAVMPYAKTLFTAGVPLQGLCYQTPPLATLINHPCASADDAGKSLVKISPGRVLFSAMKKSDNGSGIVLRVYNPEAEGIDAHFSSDEPLRSVHLTDLSETRLHPVELAGRSRWTYHVPAYKIVTLEINFEMNHV
ncbi:MAG: glycoside hydrolase family 38 C-terminal domain-containing protein [Candidatus Zhuqueibacterota bacterium]